MREFQTIEGVSGYAQHIVYGPALTRATRRRGGPRGPLLRVSAAGSQVTGWSRYEP
jgi:hypothetical protein